MNPTTTPTESAGLPEVSHREYSTSAASNVLAIAGVVIKEMPAEGFYVLFVLTALITVVMGSVTFFNQDNIVRYLEIAVPHLGRLLVIAITTAARQIPAEREQRTLFRSSPTRHAKPVRARQVFGCWLPRPVVLHSTSSSSRGWREGTRMAGAQLFSGAGAALVHAWHCLRLTVSVRLSSRPRRPTTPSRPLGALLLGRHLNKVALKLAEPLQTIIQAVYYTLPHLELFEVRDLIVHNWGLNRWEIWAAGLAYAAVYSAIFLALACLFFRRKAVN
jgi:hypothetical protein